MLPSVNFFRVRQRRPLWPFLGKAMAKKNRRVVYSTDDGEMDRIREMARKAQRPVPVRSKPPGEQVLRIKREKKGRGGKTVTVIYDLVLSAEDKKALAKKLKKACGVGGAVKDDTIVIQGDVRDRVSAELQKQGYKTKFAGG